jgi:hypothetical protein
VAGTAVKGTIASAPIRRTGKLGAGAVLAVSAAILVTAVLQRRRAGSLRSDALSLLTVFGLLHYSAYAFWLWIPGEDDYRLYYFMPQVMLASAALGGALGPPARRWIRSVWLRRALAAVGIVLLTQHLYDGILSRYEWRPWEAGPVAEKGLYGWVRRTFPEEAVLGARDAGKLGFFTERPVVNLDGLINDQRLLEAIRHDREDEYLLSSPVRYVLIGRPWLQGFDASNPQIPPRERGGLGETLYRLAQRPGVSLRDVTPGPGEGTEDWAVIEILRGGGDFSRNRAIRPAP